MPAPQTSVARQPTERDRAEPVPVGRSRRSWRLAAWGVLALAAVALFASAWLDDDAFITLRVVENLLEGRGPVWNVAERVQVYTHPLWMGLVAALIAVTGSYEPTLLATSMALSLTLVPLLIFRLASSVRWGCVCALALLLSKSFVDFATSGLEDPLTRLLLAAFVLVATGEETETATRDLVLALLAGLATLCRPDALLLFLPALAVRFARPHRPRRLAATLLGLAPVALWGLFALVYYGSPFPNTAYAKLGTGVPRLGVVLQGGAYLLESLVRDPATLVVFAAALIFVVRRGGRARRALALGAVLYLLYVVWIGGGYMSGRFLGLPLVAMVATAATLPAPRLDRRAAARLLAVSTLLLVPRMVEPFVQSGVGIFGIGDERRTHHPYTGLIHAPAPGRWPEHSLRLDGERLEPGSVTPQVAVGMVGFYAHPQAHLVDVYALTDPLLARLPGRVEHPINGPRRIGWRPGHLRRPLPEGYLASLPEGPNRIADRDLRELYEVIRLVTRAPLSTPGRLRAIVDLQLGRYDRLAEAYVKRHRHLFRPAERPDRSR